MYFPSKKDNWLAFVILGAILLVILSFIFDGNRNGWPILEFIICLLVIGLPLWIWLGTGYKLEEGLIKIRCGPFKSTVRIKEITKLSATKSPLSAPALSLDRIEITHGMYNMAIVSPKNKIDFISILLSENPDIQVDKNLIRQQSG
ncbi:PH domain-containing protein [Evansella cellulosilytica]|uniref:Uncharacterized protein YyaB-like PH domain-containing protein n=1 Tax=Evansella cellulosilytica (strain ATCC 21833 / DSM 2522 / FERM P-1141 / JCM 9156 / N-4) TaxID=649639 RepID=E6TQF1_EVAC2|nr:PH domain-containing protein [Evansella cellulosilytica]ADU29329.1 hypothetical protein Bcell_1056 [Evansella cellulosilytica DSM 2522]